jgi:hypothetical protein
MVVILVLLTIVGFIAVELITLRLMVYRNARKSRKENVSIFEQPLLTMTDGGEPVEEEKKK